MQPFAAPFPPLFGAPAFHPPPYHLPPPPIPPPPPAHHAPYPAAYPPQPQPHYHQVHYPSSPVNFHHNEITYQRIFKAPKTRYDFGQPTFPVDIDYLVGPNQLSFAPIKRYRQSKSPYNHDSVNIRLDVKQNIYYSHIFDSVEFCFQAGLNSIVGNGLEDYAYDGNQDYYYK